MHSECALLGEPPEDKCICVLCKEDQQQPVTHPCTSEIQTTEAAEENEGQLHLVEMTIQTNAGIMKVEQTDFPEETPAQKATSEEVLIGQAEATADKETPMELGKCDLGSMQVSHVLCCTSKRM